MFVELGKFKSVMLGLLPDSHARWPVLLEGLNVFTDHSMVHSSSHRRVYWERGREESGSSRGLSLSTDPWNNVGNDGINARIWSSHAGPRAWWMCEDFDLLGRPKLFSVSRQILLCPWALLPQFIYSVPLSHCIWVQQPNLVAERCIAGPCPAYLRSGSELGLFEIPGEEWSGRLEN